MKYYKVLSGGKSCNGGDYVWDLPTKNSDGTWTPGKWTEKINGDLIPCKNGYHICRKKDLVYWLNKEIYEAEYRGEIIRDYDKCCVVREARLLCKIESWNEKTARLFAADCAERTLPIYESQYPKDKRLRLAIKAARDYANGKITEDDLLIVGSAAWVAVDSVTYSSISLVLHSNNWQKLISAKCLAIESAANSAAKSALPSSLWVTDTIASSLAARSVAWSDSESDAFSEKWMAAYLTERKWQTKRLIELLGI